MQQHGCIPEPSSWAKEARPQKVNVVGLHLCEGAEDAAKWRNHNSVCPETKEGRCLEKDYEGSFSGDGNIHILTAVSFLQA